MFFSYSRTTARVIRNSTFINHVDIICKMIGREIRDLNDLGL